VVPRSGERIRGCQLSPSRSPEHEPGQEKEGQRVSFISSSKPHDGERTWHGPRICTILASAGIILTTETETSPCAAGSLQQLLGPLFLQLTRRDPEPAGSWAVIILNRAACPGKCLLDAAFSRRQAKRHSFSMLQVKIGNTARLDDCKELTFK
jgi:hypothetical protein